MPQTKNRALSEWVDKFAKRTRAADVRWCSGSADEYDELCELLVSQGTFTKLSDAKRPASYWAHSDPRDVARVESRAPVDQHSGKAHPLQSCGVGPRGRVVQHRLAAARYVRIDAMFQ